MRKNIFLYIISIVFAINLQANESTTNYNNYFHFGGYLHYLMNNHSAEFSTLSGCKSCNPGFTGGFGNGFALGGLIEFPLNNNNLTIGLRAGYSLRNSNFFKEEKIGNGISKGISAPNVTDIIVEHSLLAKLSTIDIEPNINYNFWDNFRFSLGVKAAFLMGKTFSQKEKIISPSGIVFNDTKTIERNIYTDETIKDAKSLLTYLTPAISYDFRFASGFVIAPELRIELPLYNMVDIDWKPMAINLGISVRMPVMPKKPTRDTTIYIRDTITVQGEDIAANEVIKLKSTNKTESMEEYDDHFFVTKYVNESYERVVPKLDNAVPQASIDAFGVDIAGNRVNTPQLVVEEVTSEESFPMLPQIFFTQNSSDLTKTRIKLLAKDDVTEFDEQKLDWNTLVIYNNLLNIIGYRMNKYSNSKLEIIGCNNGTEEEKNNTALSKNRAEAVREYLHNIWNIPNNRLIVKSRNLPERNSNNNNTDGDEENRRVELYSANAEILKPVTLSDIHKTANPPIIRIQPSINSESPIEEARILIEQNGTEIRNILLDDLNKAIDWTVDTKPIPDLESPVAIHLTAKAKNGQIGKAVQRINIEQRTIKKKKHEMMDDKRIESYSLILFDFNKTSITPQHRDAIKLVKSRISPKSQIKVIGYTDRTGNEEYNMQLSRERAANVAKLLGAKPEKVTILGKGGQAFLYSNDLPEGRCYNRTVRIIVETPIEHK